MEAKQEENKIPTTCMQKVHKMFVNVHKQSTHVLKNLSILYSSFLVGSSLIEKVSFYKLLGDHLSDD